MIGASELAKHHPSCRRGAPSDWHCYPEILLRLVLTWADPRPSMSLNRKAIYATVYEIRPPTCQGERMFHDVS